MMRDHHHQHSSNAISSFRTRSTSSMMLLLLQVVFLTFLAGILGVEAQPQQSSTSALEPARVSCNAAYSAPCARTNAEYLATTIAAYELTGSAEDFFGSINAGAFNFDTGFYPFVFETETSNCVAHGANPDLVGKTLEQIFRLLNIGFSDAPSLQSRFEAAANVRGGDWVQYLWSDGGSTNSKLAFVTNFTNSPALKAYYIGVGYEDKGEL